MICDHFEYEILVCIYDSAIHHITSISHISLSLLPIINTRTSFINQSVSTVFWYMPEVENND